MKLYHGSNTAGIAVLQPRQADHDRPYVYLTQNKVVATLYLCNPLEKPYYWFPYGFDKEGKTVYHELYPHALQDVAEGKEGWLYVAEADEDNVQPFAAIPGAYLSTEDVPVQESIYIRDAYAQLLQYEKEGLLHISRFEEKSRQSVENWHAMLLAYLQEKRMKDKPECSYAQFIRKKFPQLWITYLEQNEN